jgi:hypothetical protein
MYNFWLNCLVINHSGLSPFMVLFLSNTCELETCIILQQCTQNWYLFLEQNSVSTIRIQKCTFIQNWIYIEICNKFLGDLLTYIMYIECRKCSLIIKVNAHKIDRLHAFYNMFLERWQFKIACFTVWGVITIKVGLSH